MGINVKLANVIESSMNWNWDFPFSAFLIITILWRLSLLEQHKFECISLNRLVQKNELKMRRYVFLEEWDKINLSYFYSLILRLYAALSPFM